MKYRLNKNSKTVGPLQTFFRSSLILTILVLLVSLPNFAPGSSFLTNRSISVVVDGQASDMYHINAGFLKVWYWIPHCLLSTLMIFYPVIPHCSFFMLMIFYPVIPGCYHQHSGADDCTLHSTIQTAKPVSTDELNGYTPNLPQTYPRQ